MVRMKLCFAVLLAVFGNGLCLKCFHCLSVTNKPKCAENSLNFTAAELKTHLQECSLKTLLYNQKELQNLLPAGMLGLPEMPNKKYIQSLLDSQKLPNLPRLPIRKQFQMPQIPSGIQNVLDSNMGSVPPLPKTLPTVVISFRCVKITTVQGDTARTCLPRESFAACTYLQGKKQMKTCMYCDKDGCNGTSAIYASLPVALLALAVSYIQYNR
ncbi:hypothetical protein NE865_09264 [Phthorimaea operculella]|nr:hypothetical protein NE865_09264 [Phthorimaea operculella]